MSTELGQAYVQIIPSAQGMGAKLTKAMNGEMDGAGKIAGLSIGKAIIGAIGAAGIGVAVKKAVTEGAALEQSLGGVETLFKSHADVVIANANKAWETAGLSANQYMEQSTSFAASLLQSLGGDTQAAAKYADMAIIDMSDNANKMGTSIENIQNAYQGFAKQNYTMLDNLKLGYGGTKSEMERLLADASKISGQKYDISNLSDVYEAIHVIQGELDITGTTAKEAASTISGSFNSMKSAGTNLLGAMVIGADVEAPMKALAQSATTFFVGNLIPALGRLGGGIANAMDTLGDYMASNMDGMIATAGKIVSGLVTGLVQNAPKLIGGAIKIAAVLSQALIGGLVSGMKTAAQKAISTLMSNLDVKSKIQSWINGIKSKFPFNIGRILSLKIPTIKVNGGKAPWGIGGAGTKPSFSVQWHAEGGIFTQPTILGNQGFGEAGAEAILPLDKFWSQLDQAVGNGGGGALNLVINLDGEPLAKSTINYINGQTLRFGVSPLNY